MDELNNKYGIFDNASTSPAAICRSRTIEPTVEMALRLVSFCPPRIGSRLQQNLERPPRKSSLIHNKHIGRWIRCAVATEMAEPSIIRRNANYQSPVFDFNVLQSLKSTYTGDAYLRRIDRMVEEARGLLMETKQPIAKLELIGSLQRLGLDYHYENEVRQALEELQKLGQSELGIEKHLSATSLFFRLLRQYRLEVSTDVFNSFLDETGSFKSCLCQDTRGLLCLYEASHLGFTGEDILDEAKAFTTKHLKQVLAQGQVLDPPHLSEQIKHALELPMHYMDPRVEARWYIEEVYEKEEHMKPSLLQLARLDYNRLQALYQRNLIDMSRWWKDLGTMDKMPFMRDRIMECFLFALGVSFEPQYQYSRDEVTKVNQLVTMVDDIYDIFGSMEELELFTDAVRRWDTDAIQNLPDYMKVCYMVLFNSINLLAYDTLKDQGVDVIPCLRKLWVDLCEAYLMEAKWYHIGYTPTFEEYLKNAYISISGTLVLAHGYFSMRLKVTPEVLEALENYHGVVLGPAKLLRLCDDWGTSTYELARGDVPKAVESYMNKTGASEEEARKYVRRLIDETWKQLNKDCIDPSPFPRAFINGSVGLGRASENVYQFGDGFGRPHDFDAMKNRITGLVVEPIPV